MTPGRDAPTRLGDMMSTPAGWYPQPDGRLRYWDGTAWTEHFHDPTAAAAEPAAQAGAADSAAEPP